MGIQLDTFPFLEYPDTFKTANLRTNVLLWKNQGGNPELGSELHDAFTIGGLRSREATSLLKGLRIICGTSIPLSEAILIWVAGIAEARSQHETIDEVAKKILRKEIPVWQYQLCQSALAA
jgi:hypothetical protein